MSNNRKIIGVTVGTTTPRADLKQTDPRKADYVKGKDIIPTKLSQLENDAEYLTKETAAAYGGYYTPNVTQNSETTMKVSFAASKEGMEAIPDQEIVLPSGERGEPGKEGAPGKDGIAPVVTLEETAIVVPGNIRYTTNYLTVEQPDGSSKKVSWSAINGGYFQPTVSDDGDLSWEYISHSAASNMFPLPFVETKNIRGKDGSDAEVTAENIKKALGYTPANENQGTENAGKILGIGDDGIVVPVDAPSGGSGGSGEPGADGYSPTATVEQTSTGAVITITDKNGTTTATVKNGKDGNDGAPGKDGSDGQPGKDGSPGADGQPGKDGIDGKDGNGIKSAVLNADYTLTLNFDDGTSYTTPSIRGATGATGATGQPGSDGKDGSNGKDGSPGSPGQDGADGVGIASIEQTTTSTADGGNNVFTVTLTNGQKATFTVKNGSKGSTGDPGKDGKNGSDATVTATNIQSALGYAPAKQSDVEELSSQIGNVMDAIPEVPVQSVNGKTGAVELTASDVGAATQGYVDSEIVKVKAQVNQMKPEFANSIEECVDTSKMYVLPDGYIYAHRLTEIETGPAYTNVLPLAINSDGTPYVGTNGEKGYKTGWRLNSSGVEKEQAGCMVTGFIAAKAGDVVRIKNFTPNTAGYGYMFPYKSDFTKYGDAYQGSAMSSAMVDGVLTVAISTQFANAASSTAYIRLSATEFSENTIVTINEEITEGGGTTTGYAWVNTGLAFAPADYEDRIVDLETKVVALEDAVADGTSGSDRLLYIAPDGNDSNSGLMASAPKKTVKACVNAGATRISAKRGVYAENISLYNVGELEIFPTDNDQAYSATEIWPPIVFDTSDNVEVSSLAAYNAIKRVAYSNSANTQFDKVFVAKSQPPVIGDGYGSKYNSTVWLLSEDEKTVCVKLKPVLTVAECEAENNTFTYVGGYIYINADWTNVAKIKVPTNWGSGIRIENAKKLVLREVEVRFSGTYNIWLLNCPYFDFYKCASKYTSYGSGFDIDNANGVFNNCYATKNYDGFGISGYGHTTFIDCVSEFNFDDGVSHHNGSEGTFIGGRYEGNGKGGNTPAYGAKVNIYGGVYKNNASFGIGYLYTSTHNPASGMVQGAVIVGNPVGLSVNANCDVTMLSCVLKDNTKEREIKGNLTEYGTVTD